MSFFKLHLKHAKRLCSIMSKAKFFATLLAPGLGANVTRESIGNRLTAHIWKQKGMPWTDVEASEQGWQEVGAGCHPSYGHQFQRPSVLTPTLMFDNTGHIAGMQFAVDTKTFPLYPGSNLKMGEGVHSTGLDHNHGDAALTVFFMDPSKICSANAADHDLGSVGDRLWVQNNQNPSGYDIIPSREDGAIPDGYIASGCAAAGFAYPGSPGMGTHYWRMQDDQGNTPCEDSGPMFLLYSRGRLVAFGLTFVGFDNHVPTVDNERPIEVDNHLVMANDELWEFARQPLDPFFFSPADNPKCLNNFNRFDSSLPGGTITTGTLHVFLSNPYEITCDGFEGPIMHV